MERMGHVDQQAKRLQITALSAALMGVYGIAGAQQVQPPLVCKDSCDQPAPGTDFYGDSTGDSFEWVVKAENSTLTLTEGSVEGFGHRIRAVGSTAGSTVTLDGVTVITDTGGGSNWGSHGIQAEGSGSILHMNGGSISTTGEYSNGIQAGADGRVTGTGVDIRANGVESYTFGVEANTGGLIDLIGGSIDVTGKGAAGARSYSDGEALLDGTSVTVTGASSTGLMAGDTSGATTTAGDITFKNSAISVDGTNAKGAHVQYGSALNMDNATLTVTADGGEATGVLVNGPSSSVNARNVTVRSTAPGAAKGLSAEQGAQISVDGGLIETIGGTNSHAMDSYQAGSRITATNVDVRTTGYAAGAFNGGEVVLNGGTLDVVGTTPVEGWDTDAGFVVGGSAAGSKLSADNVTLINSVPLVDGTPAYTSYAMRVGADFGTALDSKAELSLANSDVIASGLQRRVAYVQNNSHLRVTDSHLVSELDAGIILADNAELTLDGTTLEAKEESLRSSFSVAGSQQTISITGNSVLEKNNGTLLRVSRNETAQDGVVRFTLGSGVYVSGDIRNVDGDGILVAHDDTLTILDIDPGALWAGIVVDGGTRIIDDGDGPQDNFTTGGDVSIGGDAPHQFNGATDIGGSASVGAGKKVAFNGPATIGVDLIGQEDSSTTINGSSRIGGTVTGAEGSTFSFNGDTAIGGDVQGAESSFHFSQTAPTTIAGDVNLYSGSIISGGSTDAPIEIGGSANIDTGSVLGGNLNVAGVLTGDGGILSPGNSIGAHTYGAMGQFTAGTYVAEINASGQSDLITISSGSADLRGIDLLVSQESGNGGYRLNHDYTIVKTGDADGISSIANNQFANENLDETFAGTLVKLDDAKYGANMVTISLSADRDVIGTLRPSMSSNQNATLDGVLSVIGQNASADATLQLPDYKDALNQLSGELHASTQAALLQNSSTVSRTLTQRMRGNLGAGMLAGAPIAQAGGSLPAGAMPSLAAYPLWAQVVGNWSTLDSDGNAAKVKTETTGLFIGGDAEVGSGWRIGGALGYTDGRVKVDSRGSRSDVESYTAALYAGNSWDHASGKLNFLLGAAYTHHDVDSRRNVSVGGAQTLKADYRANTTQLFTELGYAMPVGERSVVEPYLGLAWIDQKAKSFTESGGPAALRGTSQSDDITTFTLGLRGQTAIDIGETRAHLSAGLGWRHASGDVDPSHRLSFVEGGGTSFNVSGAPIAKNAAVVDLGFEMAVGNNTAMGLGYNGQYGDDNIDHSGMLFLRTRF